MGESCYLCKGNETEKDISYITNHKNVPNSSYNHFSPISKALNNIWGYDNISVNDIAFRMLDVHSNERNSALMELQKTHGNQYVQQVATGIQAKLKISQPEDIYEQEADRVAEQVMRMTEPEMVQRKCPEDKNCPPELEERNSNDVVQLKTDQSVNGEISVRNDLLGNFGSGKPLDKETRDFMEPIFGEDFGKVRLHTNALANNSAKLINAFAYTSGENIVFREGQYSPGTLKGKSLIAHELTHVIQQRSLGKDFFNMVQMAGPAVVAIKPVILALLALIAACGLPFHLYALYNYRHKTDKWRHCWVSCQMSKTCGVILTEIAGLGKEIRDRAVAAFCDHYPRNMICTSGHGDFWDSIGDLKANQECIAWEAQLVGPLARLWRQSCKDCCDAFRL